MNLFRLFVAIGALLGGSAVAWAGDGFVLSIAAVDQPLEVTLADVERAHKLGATHFNIQLALCQANATSNEVRWCDPGNPGDYDSQQAAAYRRRAARLARALHARGFTTGLLPMLLAHDTSTPEGQWRGFFEPSDFAAWSESYLSRLEEMAEIANSAQVSDFIVGTELVRICVPRTPSDQPARTAFWRAVYARMHARLAPGTSVILVANWDQAEKIPFWDASDFVALSSYFPLAETEKSDTSVESLVAHWAPWQARLLALAAANSKPLYFSEVGYASESNAAHEPWGWNGTLDLELQRRLYAAFATAWSGGEAGSKLVRFLVWALDVPSNPAPMTDGGFDVVGKPAEEALAKAFHRRQGRSN